MTDEKIEKIQQTGIDNAKDIAILKEVAKSNTEKISETEKVVAIVHELASDVKLLTGQIKNLAESVEKSIVNLEERLRESSTKFEERLQGQGQRLGAIESRPAKKWDNIIDKVLMGVVGAILAFVLAKVGLTM